MPKPAAAVMTFPIQLVELAESLARARQGDVAQVYARIGITQEDLQRTDASISLAQFEALMHLMQDYLLPGEPRSIQVLRHMPVTAQGLVGMAAMTADTLGDALDIGLRYFSLILPFIELYRENVGNRTHVHVRSHHDFGSPYNEIIMEVLVGGFAKMEFFARGTEDARTRSWPGGMEVQLTHESSEDAEAFRAYFHMPVQFGCAENQFVFSRETLSQPLLTRNRATRIAIEALLEQRLHALPQQNALTQRVRRQLSVSMAQGKLPGAAELAANLAMSSRTLSRRLSEEGSSLPALMEDVRIERAEMLLIGSDMALARIARQVGYSDLSTFSRAFKRVKGRPPSTLRNHPDI
ncbi:MAG: AraC family transcriptional regulator ligand-binding domain-containing protein [bacterium]|nr:AraC family transcriptional regulator ligand-binding domain-containing protein [bacterium]